MRFASALTCSRSTSPAQASSRWFRTVVAAVAVMLVAAVVPLARPAVSLAASTLHVSVDGDDSGSGSVDDPLRTISRAVSRASDGDQIVVGAGRFHEQVQVYGKEVHLVGAGEGATVLDGAVPVSGWSQSGGLWWVPWSTDFPTADDIMTLPDNRIAGHPEQFFVDGVAVEEVASLAEVGAGRFFYDKSAGRVWIGDDPSGRLVEGSVLNWGLYLNHADGSTVDGLTVTRFATAQRDMAAVRAYADDVTVSNVTVSENAYQGMSAIGSDITFDQVTAFRNGHAGLHGHFATNFVVSGASIVENNAELFDPAWAAGGIKVTTSTGFTITDSFVHRNDGPAVWLDLEVVDSVIARNVVTDNRRAGMMLELSSDITVVDNLVMGNGQAGLYVLESQDTRLWHNTVLDNHWDLRILTGPRDDVDGVDVFNNVFGGEVRSGQAIMHADDWTSNRSAEQMNIDWDHNMLWWPESSQARWVSRIQNWPASQSLSTTLGEHQVATLGEAQHSVLSRGAVNPFVRDYASGDGRAVAGASLGAVMPERVAVQAGVGSGAVFASGAFSDLSSVMGDSSVVSAPTTTVVGGGDDRAPYAPGSPTADVVVGNTITFAWGAADDDVAVVAYEVFANGVLLATVGELFVVIDYLDAGDYWLQVLAVDGAGNRSVKTAPVMVSTGGGGSSPTTTTTTVPATTTTTTTTTTVPATTTTASTTTTTTVPPTTTVPETTSSTVPDSTTVPSEVDQRPPSAPLNPTAATVGDVIVFSWDEAVDDIGIEQYIVYRNNDPVITTRNTSTAIDFLPPGDHWLQVRAIDTAGQPSVKTSPVKVTLGLPAEQPPVQVNGPAGTDLARAVRISTQP